MSQGTAPRRVSPGIWVTRNGRTLTPAGATYWENHYRQGLTDGRGHMGADREARIAAARQAVTGPRLEANPYPPRPDSPETLAKRRAAVIASQALNNLQPALAASRAAAPGRAVSGYHFLAATLGPNLAGLLPGTLNSAGRRPKYSLRDALTIDLLGLSPWGRGVRPLVRVARAVKAGRSAAEIVRASRTPAPFFGPAYRAAMRTYIAQHPDLSSAYSASGDPYDIEFTPARLYKAERIGLSRQHRRR